MFIVPVFWTAAMSAGSCPFLLRSEPFLGDYRVVSGMVEFFELGMGPYKWSLKFLEWFLDRSFILDKKSLCVPVMSLFFWVRVGFGVMGSYFAVSSFKCL